MDKAQIRQTYIQSWLEDGKRPSSVFSLAKKLNLEESAFYEHYSSLDAIDKDIWLQSFHDTLSQLEKDGTYNSYNSRERLLAFYFLWIQKLRGIRSFLILQRESLFLKEIGNSKLETFKTAFFEYAKSLIKLAEEGKEIKSRKYLSDHYPHGFWLQTLFVLNYWLKDDSENFEDTDAAVEKAVNLSFMLLGETALDGILDFGKFIFKKS